MKEIKIYFTCYCQESHTRLNGKRTGLGVGGRQGGGGETQHEWRRVKNDGSVDFIFFFLLFLETS